MQMLRWMCAVTKFNMIINGKNQRTRKVGEISKESPGKEVEVVWVNDAKRSTM